MTRFELTILKRLAADVGNVVTKEELVKALYPEGPRHGDESNCLEVFVGRIRKKIGRELIKTVRGVGYKLITLPDCLQPAPTQPIASPEVAS